MGKITLASALSLLPTVGPIIAAAPQFKAIWDDIVSTFDPQTEQPTLKTAYEHAVSDAENAHTSLQDIVRRHNSV